MVAQIHAGFLIGSLSSKTECFALRMGSGIFPVANAVDVLHYNHAHDSSLYMGVLDGLRHKNSSYQKSVDV